MPQTWTSDDTDAVQRLSIQSGTSLVFPPITMGAHVSVVPNHQVGRGTSLQMRGLCAMMGDFGYELDITKFTEEERQVFLARYWYLAPVEEIARRMKFSASKTKSMLHRMRGRLRNRLTEEGLL